MPETGIVNETDLINLGLLTKNQIDRLSRRMGVIGRKPRRYFLSRVMDVLNEIANSSTAKAGSTHKRVDSERKSDKKQNAIMIDKKIQYEQKSGRY